MKQSGHRWFFLPPTPFSRLKLLGPDIRTPNGNNIGCCPQKLDFHQTVQRLAKLSGLGRFLLDGTYLIQTTESHVGGPPVIHGDKDTHRERSENTQRRGSALKALDLTCDVMWTMMWASPLVVMWYTCWQTWTSDQILQPQSSSSSSLSVLTRHSGLPLPQVRQRRGQKVSSTTVLCAYRPWKQDKSLIKVQQHHRGQNGESVVMLQLLLGTWVNWRIWLFGTRNQDVGIFCAEPCDADTTVTTERERAKHTSD